MSKPPPFERPAVGVSNHGRSWQLLRAEELEVGDIVPDKGLVLAVSASASRKITVEMVNGDSHTFGVNDKVRAFSKKKELDK